MASVAVQSAPQPIGGDPQPVATQLNEKAQTFLSTIEVKETPPTDVSPGTTAKKAQVFILNSTDFQDLQLYLQAGLRLPQTPEIFATTYPEASIKEFLKSGVDDGIYEALKTQLPVIHQHCQEFATTTISETLGLSGYIANFAETATQHYDTIYKNLKIITASDKKLSDQEVKTALAKTRQLLSKLIRWSEDTEKKCNDTKEKLVKFQVSTAADKVMIDKLHERFQKVMPDKSGLKSALQKIIDEAKALVEAAREQVQAQHDALIESGKDHWYYYIPIIGAILLIVNIVKQKGLVKTLKDLAKQAAEAQASAELKEAQTLQAFHQVDGLTDRFNNVHETITKAIEAVGKMAATFAMLQSDFGKLKNGLGDIDGDVTEKYVEDRLLGFEDLDAAKATWSKIHGLAADFQSHGQLLNLDDSDD